MAPSFDLFLSPGWHLVANQFETGGNTVMEIWPEATEGAVFRKFNNTTRQWSAPETFRAGVGWIPGTTVVKPGEAGLFYTHDEASLEMGGETPTPTLPVSLPLTGCILVGSQLPVPASFGSATGAEPYDGLRVYRFLPGIGFTIHEFDFGVWSPFEPIFDWGEGFWICAPGSVPAPVPPAPPTLSAIRSVSGPPGQAIVVTNIVVRDIDTPRPDLRLSATTSNPTLFPDENIVIGGAGQMVTLTLLPAPGAQGVAEVILIAEDPEDGMATSRFTAGVGIDDGPPQILSAPPPRVEAAEGGQVRLEVEVRGAGPLSYVWRRNGVVLRNERGPVLVLPDVRSEDGGMYTVIVRNELGIVETAPTIVTALGPTAAFLEDDWPPQGAPATGISGTARGSNAQATRQPGEPEHGGKPGGRSVWFAWEAKQGGIVTLSSLGSSFDTLIAVYTGENLLDPSGRLNVADGEDEAGFFNSEVRFNAEAGRRYYIAVDGFHGQTGDIVVNWRQVVTDDRLPQIRRHPESLALRPGQRAIFEVFAEPDDSGRPLGYQWHWNGRPLRGATQPRLTNIVARAETLGAYHVEVWRQEGAGARGAIRRSRVARLELTTRDNPRLVSVDKFEDARFRGAGVSAGTPGAHAFVNSDSTRQFAPGAGCSTIPADVDRWIPIEISEPGTLVVDTFGSEVNTLAALFTNGPTVLDIGRVGCNDDADAGLGWSLFATRIETPGIYSLQIEVLEPRTNLVQVNWIHMPDSAEAPAARLFAWRFPDAPLIRDLDALISGLKVSTNPLAAFLRSRLSPTGLAVVNDHDPTAPLSMDVLPALIRDLNDVIAGPLFYNELAFAGVALGDGIEAGIRAATMGSLNAPGLAWLNRALLAAAFPDGISGFPAYHIRLVHDPVAVVGNLELSQSQPGGGAGWAAFAPPQAPGNGWLRMLELPPTNSAGFVRARPTPAPR
jgi:hypothetical protein